MKEHEKHCYKTKIEKLVTSLMAILTFGRQYSFVSDVRNGVKWRNGFFLAKGNKNPSQYIGKDMKSGLDLSINKFFQ